MGSGHQGGHPFGAQDRQGVERFLDRGGPVVDAGDQVAVEIGE
jgi:hypothetical protein